MGVLVAVAPQETVRVRPWDEDEGRKEDVKVQAVGPPPHLPEAARHSSLQPSLVRRRVGPLAGDRGTLVESLLHRVR